MPKGHGTYGRMVRTFGRTVCDQFVRASQDLECPRCGAHHWNAKRVEGFVTDTKCDARCQGAKGHMCECSCGGKNHGQGFLVCEEIAA
jgi:hypothetical protein